MTDSGPDRPLFTRTVHPLTAVGIWISLVAGTIIIFYLALTAPGWLAAQEGPPEEFVIAATNQAAARSDLTTPTGSPAAPEDGQTSAGESGTGEETAADSATTPRQTATPSPSPRPTENPYGEWPLPDWVEERYWLSIPIMGLEAPIIALSPRPKEVNGVTVLRLPVPNSYAVSWDETSAPPGFQGNTILTGHSNLYGGVFSNLNALVPGSEIAIWSEFGVFSYYVSEAVYLEENDQPMEVRYQNAEWLNDTPDDRLTIITCWPNSNSSYRLVVIAIRG